jgi:hypothetical protein
MVSKWLEDREIDESENPLARRRTPNRAAARLRCDIVAASPARPETKNPFHDRRNPQAYVWPVDPEAKKPKQGENGLHPRA